MNTVELKNKILKAKEKTGTVILAHTYQNPEIIELADITGDSFALAKKSLSAGAKRVIMCGVRFMAESVKILSPDTEVILPVPEATCPMAEMITPERVRKYKEENPGAVVVAYINTTAALKAECDVCVTSSSALKIVEKIDAPEILFIPDKNLGSFVKEHFPEKNIVLWDGYCPIHATLTEDDILKAKSEHPEALLAVQIPACVQTHQGTDNHLRTAYQPAVRFALHSWIDHACGSRKQSYKPHSVHPFGYQNCLDPAYSSVEHSSVH